MYKQMKLYISVALAIVGGILAFMPDMILNKDTKNATLKSIYDNAMLVGIVLGCIAYYLYSTTSKGEFNVEEDNMFEEGEDISYTPDDE